MNKDETAFVENNDAPENKQTKKNKKYEVTVSNMNEGLKASSTI